MIISSSKLDLYTYVRYIYNMIYLQLFMRFGLPRVITSDQGSEFNNSLDTELMEMLGIEHRLTTPYHPQVCMIYMHKELALI